MAFRPFRIVRASNRRGEDAYDKLRRVVGTRDEAALGWELSRLVGLERAMGMVTFYVTFDLAFVLDLASRCGISSRDRRERELVAWLESLKDPYGLWQHDAHPQLSRGLTFDLECGLRRLSDGDWVRNEDAANFTPFQCGRRRYWGADT